jgi:hypothetical protein
MAKGRRGASVLTSVTWRASGGRKGLRRHARPGSEKRWRLEPLQQADSELKEQALIHQAGPAVVVDTCPTLASRVLGVESRDTSARDA